MDSRCIHNVAENAIIDYEEQEEALAGEEGAGGISFSKSH
jgi:hypothetical protein